MDPPNSSKYHSRREVPQGLSLTTEVPVSMLSLPTSPTSADGKSENRVEPKSEYLRKALQDRKEARFRSRPSDNISVLSDPTEYSFAVESRPQTPSPVRNLPSPEPSLYEDDWPRESREIEDRPRNSARKVRGSSATGLRPSELSPYGGTPSRDVQTRLDKLSNENFNLKHRLTLQQEQVNSLVTKLEKALEEIKALKASEEEKEIRTQKLERAIDRRDAEIQQLHMEKAELFALHDEMAREMEKKDEAIDEATEMIMLAEEESLRVKAELEALKLERHDSDYYSAEADSPRLKNIASKLTEPTEPKLSREHSDYFSGPGSPQRLQTHPSLHSSPSQQAAEDAAPEKKLGPFAERARSIVREKTRSMARMQEVRKRLSYASEYAESLADGDDDSPASRRYFTPNALPSIRQDSDESHDPSLPGRPASLRPRGVGLRAMYQKGEQPGSSRSRDTSATHPLPLDSNEDGDSRVRPAPERVLATPASGELSVDKKRALAVAADRYFGDHPAPINIAAIAAAPLAPKAFGQSRSVSQQSISSSNPPTRTATPFPARDFFFNPSAEFQTSTPMQGSPVASSATESPLDKKSRATSPAGGGADTSSPPRAMQARTRRRFGHNVEQQ